jgi:hypothetical protein
VTWTSGRDVDIGTGRDVGQLLVGVESLRQSGEPTALMYSLSLRQSGKPTALMYSLLLRQSGEPIALMYSLSLRRLGEPAALMYLLLLRRSGEPTALMYPLHSPAAFTIECVYRGAWCQRHPATLPRFGSARTGSLGTGRGHRNGTWTSRGVDDDDGSVIAKTRLLPHALTVLGDVRCFQGVDCAPVESGLLLHSSCITPSPSSRK